MKIVVTGATGYIGSHTCIELLKDPNIEVIGIDSLINSDIKTLDRIETIAGRKMTFYEQDLCELTGTLKALEQEGSINGIIHFAALKAVGESVEKPLLYYHNNIVSLVNILKASKICNIPNFIFSSSCSLYGNVSTLPVNEETPLAQAESPYAHTKLIGEELLRDFVKTNTLNVVSLRYFNPVGADQSGLNGENPINKPNNLVPVITQTASGIIEQMTVYGTNYQTRDGSCIRDYIHVTDIAEAHILALMALQDGRVKNQFEIYNLGSGNGVSVIEAIEAFERVTGQKLNYVLGPRRAGDVAEIYSDSAKAKDELGWEPKYSLDDMMSSAWKWQEHLNQSL